MELWVEVKKAQKGEQYFDQKAVNASNEWQGRLLIVTERHIFILRRKDGTANSSVSLDTILENELVIEDSIPMEQVTDVASHSGEGAVVLKVSTKEEGFNEGQPYELQFCEGGQYCYLEPAKDLSLDVKGLSLDVPRSKARCKYVELNGVISREAARDFVKRKLQSWSRSYRTKFYRQKQFLKFQEALLQVWESAAFNTAILILIVSNFVFTVQELQTTDPNTASIFQMVDIIYTTLFSLDGWSVFDFVIVSVSVIMLAIPSGSAGNSLVKQMRLLRAFRLLRILSKMGNLKKIVTAITMSIVPTLQSLLIGLIVIFIFAVIGVHFFAERSEKFGSFSRAVVTLLGMVTQQQNWPSDDPLSVSGGDGHTTSDGSELDYSVVVYCFSFTIICMVVLVQVVVAVLLDKFLESKKVLTEEELISTETKEHPFDFLLEDIANKYEDGADLDKLLDQMFGILLSNSTKQDLRMSVLSKAIGMYASSEARRKEGVKGKRTFAEDTNYFAEHNPDKPVYAEDFRDLMREELRKYLQRNIRLAERGSHSIEVIAMLRAMRMMLVALDEQHITQKKAEHVAEEIKGIKDSVERIDETVQSIEATCAQQHRTMQEMERWQANMQKCMTKLLLQQQSDIKAHLSEDRGVIQTTESLRTSPVRVAKRRFLARRVLSEFSISATACFASSNSAVGDDSPRLNPCEIEGTLSSQQPPGLWSTKDASLSPAPQGVSRRSESSSALDSLRPDAGFAEAVAVKDVGRFARMGRLPPLDVAAATNSVGGARGGAGEGALGGCSDARGVTWA